MEIVDLSTFYIPFGLKKNKIAQECSREILFQLGILHDYDFGGQVVYTPLGKLLLREIESELRNISSKRGFMEYGELYLLEKELFKRTQRYGLFSQKMFHLNEKPSAVLHPTGEELFLKFYSDQRLLIPKLEKLVSVYHFITYFRNMKARRKPIILSNFKVFSGYVLFKENEIPIGEIKSLLDDFFNETWKTFGLDKFMKKAYYKDIIYRDYFIETQEGYDYYYTKNGEYFGGKGENSTKGVSVGMYAYFEELPYYFDVKDTGIFTFSIGLDRLIYALYTCSTNYSFTDLAVVPLYHVKSAEEKKEVLYKGISYSNINPKNVLFDNRNLPVKTRIQYHKLLRTKEIVKVGKWEIESIKF